MRQPNHAVPPSRISLEKLIPISITQSIASYFLRESHESSIPRFPIALQRETLLLKSFFARPSRDSSMSCLCEREKEGEEGGRKKKNFQSSHFVEINSRICVILIQRFIKGREEGGLEIDFWKNLEIYFMEGWNWKESLEGEGGFSLIRIHLIRVLSEEGGRRRLYIVKRNNFLSFGGDTILCFPSTARHGLKVYQLLVLYRFEDIAVSMVSDGQERFLEHIEIRLISN